MSSTAIDKTQPLEKVQPQPGQGEPADAADTGPQQVLALTKAKVPQSEIARLLGISQSTVSRWKQKAREAQIGRRTAIAQTTMCVIITACIIVITIAVAHLAWP